MKSLLFLCPLVLSLTSMRAQDTTLVLDTSMFNAAQTINLSRYDGWVYAPGHNPDWAKTNIDSQNWRAFKPVSLSVRDADKNEKVEGWFRLKIRLDSTFQGVPLSLNNGSWAATDVYIDGRLAASFGNTGAGIRPYKEHYHMFQLPISIGLSPGQEHLIALHVVDYISPFPQYPGRKIKSEAVYNNKSRILQLTGPNYSEQVLADANEYVSYVAFWLSISIFMALFLWLLSWLNLYEKTTIRFWAILLTLFAISAIGRLSLLNLSSFVAFYLKFCLILFPLFLGVFFSLFGLMSVYGYRIHRLLVIAALITAMLLGVLDVYLAGDIIISLANLVAQIIAIYLLIAAWKRLKGAQWVIVAGSSVSILSSALYGFFYFADIPFNFYLLFTATSLGFPISFLFYIALRFKEILAEVKSKTFAVIQITEEKQQILATQNEKLEQQVEQRTAELKASQAQLIQKEKLASLGELTAGIAHEIQNPLNFVNNYAEVNVELLEELEEEVRKGELNEVKALLTDLRENEAKIHHHGRRADAIVRGMLEHARSIPGERQSADLNTLAEEYLRISFQGIRAKDNTFNCELVTDFDPHLVRVEMVPQEIGRVLLNLYNNAFYAVSERSRQVLDATYQPVVIVSTHMLDGRIEIRVRDNGTGMAEAVREKIFQPFFTTKPTGEGTGLGLSLSYDIITKGHGGTLTVESTVGKGSDFSINLLI